MNVFWLFGTLALVVLGLAAMPFIVAFRWAHAHVVWMRTKIRYGRVIDLGQRR